MTETTTATGEATEPKVNDASLDPSVSAPQPEKAESDPTADGSETANPAPENEDKPKRSANGRIAELYAQKKTAEADATLARQEVAKLRADLDKISQSRNDQNLPFEQQDELRTRHAVKAERAEQAVADAERKADDAVRRRAEVFAERVNSVRDRIPDFDQVVTDETPISNFAADLLADSEFGPQIAYHLGKNIAEARRIAALPPHLQGAEIARIEARVSVPVRKVSNAPAPTPSVGGGSSPSVKDPTSMTQAEYEAWRKKSAA